MPIDKAFLKPIQIFARDRAKLFRRFPQLPEKIEQIRHEVFDHYMFPAEKGYKSHATQLKHIYINQFNPPNIMKFGRKVRTVLPKKQQNCSFQNLPHNMLTIWYLIPFVFYYFQAAPGLLTEQEQRRKEKNAILKRRGAGKPKKGAKAGSKKKK